LLTIQQSDAAAAREYFVEYIRRGSFKLCIGISSAGAHALINSLSETRHNHGSGFQVLRIYHYLNIQNYMNKLTCSSLLKNFITEFTTEIKKKKKTSPRIQHASWHVCVTKCVFRISSQQGLQEPK
jgi:hypothetical protein